MKKLSSEEELELFNEYVNNDSRKAFNKLVEYNMENVKLIAYKFYKRNSSIELKELIAIGNEVLVNSIIKFDHKLGYRLYSYLNKAMMNAFIKAINQNRTIPLPELKYSIFGKIYQDKIEPTTEQLLEYNLYANYSFISISINNDDNDNAEFQLEDASIEEAIIESEINEQLLLMLDVLTPEQLYVIMHFYGINVKRLKLKEIAKEFKCSVSKIISIKGVALDILKESAKYIK